MKGHFAAIKRAVNWLQIFIGTAVLLFGVLVYLVDRPPDQTYFIQNNGIDLSHFKNLPLLFGPIGDNLPAFVHVFSFILITAGLIKYRKKGYLIICINWFIIDIAFELGQSCKSFAARIVPEWFSGTYFLENTKNFFTKGTFDYLDLYAITVGAILAYLVLLTTGEGGKINE